MSSPSTDWKEEIAADEESRFASYAEIIAELQKKGNEKFGKGRALHRKQTLALKGKLEILPNLPAHAQQGLFAKAGEHQVQVRLSNGAGAIQSDKVPDVRGFGLKVLGIGGPGALGFDVTSQDFVMINRKSFGLPDPETFIQIVQAIPKGPAGIAGVLFKRFGLFGGLKKLAKLGKSQSQPFSGFATETFSTAAPIACGPYAIRLRIVPEARAALAKSDDLAKDVAAQLAKGPLRFAMQIQFYVDEARTPIENAEPDWLESDAPYLVVGYLTVPPIEIGGDEHKKLEAEVEAGKFDPWNALMVHRPLGAVMRARKATYFKSQQGRGAA
jgi:hypothetical protein